MNSEKELLIQAEHQAINDAMYWNKMVNDKNSDITKQLLSIAALLIPITGSIVLTPVYLNDALKILLGGSLFFFLISMCFGILYIYTGVHFFRKYQNLNLSRAIIYRNNREKTLREADDEASQLSIPPSQSSDLPQAFQIAFLGIGILLLVVITITLLIYK
jgi:hypothetical protein